MEDVVLHYQPGSTAGLSSVLETTENLLEPFPCRTPPVFTPWFPGATDRHRPIRPLKAAPVVIISESRLYTVKNNLKTQEDGLASPQAETTCAPHVNPQKPKSDACIYETPNCLLPVSLFNKEKELIEVSPHKHKDGFPVTDSPLKRSWSVFNQRSVLLQSSSQLLSQHFHRMVSIHRLQLSQRVKWVISRHNCGAARDIEQMWQAVSQSVRNSRLPTCNANIQRERAEIWVFCDVLHSEQVGHFLKEELQLSGRISLSVHRLGNIFSM